MSLKFRKANMRAIFTIKGQNPNGYKIPPIQPKQINLQVKKENHVVGFNCRAGPSTAPSIRFALGGNG